MSVQVWSSMVTRDELSTKKRLRRVDDVTAGVCVHVRVVASASRVKPSLRAGDLKRARVDTDGAGMSVRPSASLSVYRAEHHRVCVLQVKTPVLKIA